MNKKMITPIVLIISIVIITAIASAFSPGISINSPAVSLQLGENVMLNISSNETIALNYSIDSSNFFYLGNSSAFHYQLNGTMHHGILRNGEHLLSLRAVDLAGNSRSIDHNFTVNDTISPSIAVNITNNSRYNGSTYIFWMKVNSSEYSKFSYRLNANPYTNLSDIGTLKEKVLNITVAEGQNNITINVSDYHNNSALRSFTFNYSQVQFPTCSDALQNGDETAMDCGGSCNSCITFTVTTDKSAYNLTESVYMTVVARSNSTVNVTIKLNNEVSYRYSFVPVFVGAPIVEQRIISNTTNAGNYTIYAKLHYINTTESKNATFEMAAPASNPLSVTVNANATTVNEGSAVYFTSSVSNNISSVSYKWDFQNDGLIDSTSQNVNYSFPANGTYSVNLTVSDSRWNQTDIEMITSRKLHNISVLVRDNLTSSPIQNVILELDGILTNTSSDGKASFTMPEESYSIIAKKSGYITFSNKTAIKGFALIEIMLVELDLADPVVTLLLPEDKKTVNTNSLKVAYKAADKNSLTCSLLLNKNSAGWSKVSTDYMVQPDAESNFTIILENATYQWQIECTDKAGNTNSSSVFSFTSDQSAIENDLSVDLDEQDRSSQELISEIDNVLSEMESYNSDEKDAVDAMQLKKQLEKAKIEVQRANRDLHSLKWRRLNDTELESETNSILDRIDGLRDTTPRKISVLEKNEFVKYPSKEDVQKALLPILNKTNLKFSKKDMRALVEENFRLQSAITATTKAKAIEIEYLSGNKNKITLIEKEISASKDTAGLIFLEVIPKEVADNASKIKALFDFEVVEQDPILKIDIGKFKEFAYYVDGAVGIKYIEGIKSVLVEEKIKKKESGLLTGFVTGFVPTDGFAGDFLKTMNLRLLIELVAIIILGLVFLYYQIGGYEKLEMVFNRKLSHQMKEFDYLTVRIENYLSAGKYDESKILYNEINELFKQMAKEVRSKLYPKISDIHAKMDFTFMDNSLNEAFSSLDENDIKKALRLYNKISGLYKSLPKDYKSRIHARCMELYKKLNS